MNITAVMVSHLGDSYLCVAFFAYACVVFDPATVLTVVCAIYILEPLKLGSFAVTSRLISIPIEELSFFYGPTLYECRFSVVCA